VARLQYLADTSVFSRLTKPVVASTFAPLVAGRLVAVSAPVIFELGFSARSRGDYREMMDGLAAFPTVPTGDADHRRALEVQSQLAGRSRHRALSLVDALVAAVAEARELIVLHYDSDFETVSKLTGQEHRWIVARGSAD
jgi:predicted nucleic acid-binding protein